MQYMYGTYDETPDGSLFRVIARGVYDSDAQAEINARLVLMDSSGDYDTRDMDGDGLSGLFIRCGKGEWFVY